MPEIHLYHPMLVHFAIALTCAGLLCELVWKFNGKAPFRELARWNLIFAFAAVIVTFITGLIAEEYVTMTPAAHDVFEIHESLGYIILGLVAALFIWRVVKNGAYYEKFSALFVALFVIAVILVLIGAYFGGELVFTHGVGVKTIIAAP